jgi:putative copper export protein
VELSTWDVAAVGSKAILYAATLSAAGGIFFLYYSAALIASTDQRRIVKWIALCVGVALAASAIRPLIIAGSLGDGLGGLVDPSMVRMVLQAGEARAGVIRVAGLGVAAAVLLRSRHFMPAALLGAALSVISFATMGHAWAAPGGGWSMALLSLHLLCVAFWLGAFVPLLIIARHGDLPVLARTATRFGYLAMGGVFLLVLAGCLLLASFLNGVSDLWLTDYGRLMSLKLAGVAGLVGLAALNKLRFTPRLQEHERGAARSLERSIRVEIVVAAGILLVTATLTTLTGPPKERVSIMPVGVGVADCAVFVRVIVGNELHRISLLEPAEFPNGDG